MELSVILVNYNAAAYLTRCLASIDAFLANVAHEICVVDNASSDGSRELLEHRFPRAQLIANDRNRGFAAALNQGLEHTSGHYVLWLNPDAELLDGGMRELLDYLERCPDVGILGPRLIDPDGSLQLSCRSFPSYHTALFHRYSLLTRWFPTNRFSAQYLHTDWDHASVADVGWVSGACLLHRRELVTSVGQPDERFFMYCEDVDFCLRARRAGWAVRYHPAAVVLHHIGGSTGPLAPRMVRARHLSMWRYYAKHFPRHPVKDAVVGAAIWARCGWQMARGAFARRQISGAGATGGSSAVPGLEARIARADDARKAGRS